MRLILLVILFIIGGCVGTVEEAAAPQSLKFENPPTTFSYSGLAAVRAISHSKIEIEFFPAPGGEDVRYDLYVNNATTPVTLNPETLLKLAGGKLLYTVENLVADREYKLKLRAYNEKTAAVSTGETVMFARTFDNVVTDFKGVSQLSLVPGNTSGSIKVDWIAPPVSLFPFPSEPARYEITVISEVGGPANLNNPTYNGTDRRVTYAPIAPLRASLTTNPNSVEVDGLAANTLYYVQVRAINYLYQDYDDNSAYTTIPVSREQNTRYLSIKTDATGGLFNFRQDNVILANAPGIDAFDKIDIFWLPGTGSFTGYRIFLRKYVEAGNPATDDKLTEATLVSMTTSGNYTAVGTALSTRRITGLENNAVYQVKVALCKTVSCPVASADPNAAIISDLKSIRVRPSLAPFTGINNIEPPGQYSERDVVNLRFDPPLLGGGFANAIEFYCVDPANHNNRVKFEGNTAITATTVGNCLGLSLQGAAPPIATWTLQKVKGLVTDGTKQYCFAATPLITGYGAEVRLPLTSMIVRCSYPEVYPPRVAQFPGLKSTCSVAGTTANLAWDLPNGGIYSGFKVFWREKMSNTKFSFPAGTVGASGYSLSQDLAANVVSYAITNLVPGRTYETGVLAQVDMVTTGVGDVTAVVNATTVTLTDPPTGMKNNWFLSVPSLNIKIPVVSRSGSLFTLAQGLPSAVTAQPAFLVDVLWSEYNLKVLDCSIPLPTATFNGFTRIFAVGPKVDGRVPNDSITKAPPTSANMYEALDGNGIPYEVAMDSLTVPHLTVNYANPPGRDQGGGFTSGFDGIPEAATGFAMSRNGIVSLAWEDVSLSYAEAQTMFTANQPATSVPRTGRQWGYKVFRSSDNRLTWQELTGTHGNVYSMNYTYRHRPNAANITRRMAFFTDYSVRALSEIHDAANGRDVERARTYFYRIVPVFDGKLITYPSGNHHTVKVTLPPPNMALVHRWMTNRAHCLSFDRQPNVTQNYTCDYNGIGARPKSFPHLVGQTMLDQAGDLLVDRYELGCRYTRGNFVPDPSTGSSVFELNPPSRRPSSNDMNHFPLFRGYRTVGTAEDPTTKLMGCVGADSETRNDPTNTDDDYPLSFTPDHYRHIEGDCMGTYTDIQYITDCNDAIEQAYVYTTRLTVPGPNLSYKTTPANCYEGTATNPTSVQSRYQGEYAPNNVMQSEFLAVFYNRYASAMSSAAYYPDIEGPATTSLTDRRSYNRYNYQSGLVASQCAINLAAIGADGYMKPRWMNVNQLGNRQVRFKNDTPNLNDLTIAQLTEVNSSTEEPLTYYNGDVDRPELPNAAFKLPSADLRESNRYRDTTRVARLYSSNAAKLPPLGRLNGDIAQSICRNYFVQTGFATDAGVFAPGAAIAPKRLLRRWDSIIASAWPEHFTDAQITNIESSTNAGSCNHSGRNLTGNGPDRGEVLQNRFPASGNLTDVPLVTGSSGYIGIRTITDGNHSARCVSRFGVQDIPGNLSEANSDRIFCNYSQDQIRIGETEGTWSGGDGAVNKGVIGGVSFPFFNNNDEDNLAILRLGSPNSGPTEIEIRFRNGASAITGARPFINISDSSGYCSVVDTDPSRRTGSDVFKSANGIWNSLFLPGGTLNTAIVARTQPDQDVIHFWRNGDGRFFDFGPLGIGAALKAANQASISDSGITVTDDTTNSKYFTPTLGLPMMCSSGACDDPLILGQNDTTMVTTATLAPNVDPDPAVNDIPSISNFFVGNSQVFSTGIAEFTYDSDGYQSYTVPAIGFSNHGFTSVLQYVEVDDPTSMANPTYHYKNYPGDFASNSQIQVYRLHWSVDRGTVFGITSGSRSSQFHSGRYSASIGPVSNLASGSREFSQGARCAVTINQDD
jgi:hypothetical protein